MAEWPEILKRYVCLAVEASTPGLTIHLPVFAAPEAAYCPRCGGALADYRHRLAAVAEVSLKAPSDGDSNG